MKLSELQLKDKNVAQVITEKLLKSNILRDQCLIAMVDCITKAHQLNNNNWSISLHKDSVKFIIGNRTVIGVRINDIRVSILGTVSVPGATLEYDFSLPNAKHIAIPFGKFTDTFLFVKPQVDKFIETASKDQPKIARYHKIHSPGMMSYLRELTGIMVPSPNYV